ncbi:hypothetical protein C8R45DRAFT_1114851 [Mycena sanguinolenta]|nr:hypothetical protein C8R45DRAFT_1114851 [Mycena sanguinolenta]
MDYPLADTIYVTEDPAYHPAWDANNPSTVLQVYNQHIYPQFLDCTNSYSDLAYIVLLAKGFKISAAFKGLPLTDMLPCLGSHYYFSIVNVCQELQDATQLSSYPLDDQGEELYLDWHGHT